MPYFTDLATKKQKKLENTKKIPNFVSNYHLTNVKNCFLQANFWLGKNLRFFKFILRHL